MSFNPALNDPKIALSGTPITTVLVVIYFYDVESKNLYENRTCIQWDNYRPYGPEPLL